MKKRLVLAMVLGAASSGCDELQEKVKAKASELAQGAAEKAQGAAQDAVQKAAETTLSAEELLSEKLNLYVKCTNASKERVYDSWEYYSSGVNPETGMPLRKDSGGRVHTMGYALTPCLEAAQKAPGMKPALDKIDAAQKEYTAALQEMSNLADQLDKYYKNEDYKDDAWKLGQETAPKFKAAFEKFDKAAKSLGQLVDEQKAIADKQMLDLIEKRVGRKLEWHSKHTVMTAKTFVDCVTAVANVLPGPTECDGAFESFDKAQEEFEKSHSENAKEAADTFWMSSFQPAVGDLLAASKKLMRAVKAKSAKPEEVQALVQEYNDLVGAANNLRFK